MAGLFLSRNSLSRFSRFHLHKSVFIGGNCDINRHSSSYKSESSLQSLHPNSKGPRVPAIEDIVDTSSAKFTGFIPFKEINIIQVNTAVELRFHVDSAEWLSQETKTAIQEHLDLSKDGWLVVKSNRTESRTLNMADALEKLRLNIRKAENPVTETFPIKDREISRKAKLKAARERLHIKH